MLIPLKEWAARVGIDPSNARHKIARGTLTAVKIGRDWLIEENTSNIDCRISSGKYIGISRKRKDLTKQQKGA